jgi:hypothetical protein
MSGKVNPVTWAVLNVYAGTAEGQSVEHLGAFLRQHAPRGRMKSTASVTAEGLGALDTRGHLTVAGLTAARNAVERLNLGRAAGVV